MLGSKLHSKQEQLTGTTTCHYHCYIYYHQKKYLSTKHKIIEELSPLLCLEYLIITSPFKMVNRREIKEKGPEGKWYPLPVLPVTF